MANLYDRGRQTLEGVFGQIGLSPANRPIRPCRAEVVGDPHVPDLETKRWSSDREVFVHPMASPGGQTAYPSKANATILEHQYPDYLRHQSTPVHISRPNARTPAELDTKSVASSDQEVDDLEYALQLSLAEHQRSERLRHQSTLGHIPRENATKPQKQPQQDTNHIVIAVCGMTGTGKSTFISKIAQKQVAIGHGLQSKTAHVEEVTCQIGPYAVTLVDTPGFDDTNRSDTDVLSEIAMWMKKTYHNGMLLSAIVYLHRVTDKRVTGSSMKNLRLFRKLCGEDNMANVVLVTTMWEDIDPVKGAANERELCGTGSFWATMLAQGASTVRYNNDRGRALEIIQDVVRKSPVALKIQRELVDERIPLIDTDAGAYVNEELLKLQRKHDEQLIIAREEMDRAMESKNKALQKALKAQYERALADVEADAKARQDPIEAKLANYRDEAYSLRDKVNTYAAQANSMKEAISEMNAILARAEEMGEETGAEADLLRDALAEMEEKTTTQQDLIESKVEVYRDEARLLRTQISGYADQMSSWEKEVNAKLAEAEGNKAHDTSLRNKIQHYESRALIYN